MDAPVARQSWDSYFIGMALEVASRATCRRRHVGAVLVQRRSVRGTGYCGAPAGVPDCLDVGCMTDAGGRCVRAIHAEANLLLQTTPSEREDATVYLTDRPCWECAKLLANSGVTAIVYLRPHERQQAEIEELMATKGIALTHYAPSTAVDLAACADSHAAERIGQPGAALLEHAQAPLADRPQLP